MPRNLCLHECAPIAIAASLELAGARAARAALQPETSAKTDLSRAQQKRIMILTVSELLQYYEACIMPFIQCKGIWAPLWLGIDK